MPFAPEKIRNVAFVGHRGSGKTSLAEALLFQAGAVTRLGSVADGSTVSDHDEDEKRRTMSISGSLLHAEHEGHKLNIFDAPGDPELHRRRARRAARGRGSALHGLGRRGRRGHDLAAVAPLRRARAVPRRLHQPPRPRPRRLRAALASVQEQLSPRCVAIAIPIGSEKDFRGVVDVLHMVAYEDAGDGSREAEPGPIPADMVDEAATWRERLVEAVVEVSDELTAKYLDGEEITAEELREALHAEVLRGELFPVACGSATKNEGTHALLDLIVEGVPAPSENFIAARCGRRGRRALGERALDGGVRLQDGRRRPRRPHQLRARVLGHAARGRPARSTAAPAPRSASGRCSRCRGRSTTRSASSARATSAPCPSSRTCVAGDVLAERPMIVQGAPLPAPIVSVAVEPKVRGEDEKMATALRRLSEEDPTLRVSRDERTSELLVSGLSQMHIEVTVERVKRRFGVDIVTHPPRVPYFEAIRKKTRAHARYKKQTGGRGQFGDCHIEVEPLPAHEGYEFIDKIVGGVIPQGFRPAVDKGIQETMHAGDLAGYPVIGVRVTLVDGSYHSVDSSEMAFRIAGSMAFKKAYSEADPVLLEPIMSVEITSPSETVGDVIGDLNSRRGRPLGMDPVGQNTVIRAEVPMSEMLSYAPDLTSLTGGRGDYAMTLARYEEVPAHVSQRLIADLQREREAAKA